MLQGSVPDHSPQRREIDPRAVLVRYVADEAALGLVSHPVLRFSPVNIMPPMFLAHSFVNHQCCTTLAAHSVVK